MFFQAHQHFILPPTVNLDMPEYTYHICVCVCVTHVCPGVKGHLHVCEVPEVDIVCFPLILSTYLFTIYLFI